MIVSVSLGLAASSCAKRASSAQPEPMAPAVKSTSAEAPASVQTETSASAERPDLGAIIASLYLVPPASEAVEIEIDDVCEEEGFPDHLRPAAADKLDDAAPGQSVVVVHDEGQTVARITGVGCVEPEDYVDGATVLELDTAAGSIPKTVPPALRRFVPPYFAFVGTRPHPSAVLSPPPELDRPTEDASVRAAIAQAATEVAEEHAARCRRDAEFDPRALPSPEAINEAAGRASAWRLPGSASTVWVVFEDPALTFYCEPDVDPDAVGMLLDVATATALYTEESNSGVELQWITDLDGDGEHEALLDVTWLEDGGHEIRLLHREGTGWNDVTLYAFDEP